MVENLTTPASGPVSRLFRGPSQRAADNRVLAPIFLVAMAAAMYFAGIGWAGILGIPAIAGLVLGPLYIAFQLWVAAAARMVSGPRRPILKALLLLAILFNQVSVASGIVAQDLDAFGETLIRRQLDAQISQARGQAAALAGVAARLDAVSSHAARMRDFENPARPEGYRPTCKGSSGHGWGPYAQAREKTAATADALAAPMRAGAKQAQTAAQSIAHALAGYKVHKHAVAIAQIEAGIAAINQAMVLDHQAALAQLAAIESEAAAGSFCPDATQLALATQARAAVTGFVPQPVVFDAPAEPDERMVIFDFLTQIARAIGFQQNELHRYLVPLLAPVSLEFVLLGLFLGALRPPRTALAPSQAALRVAIDPDWRTFVDSFERQRGHFDVPLYATRAGIDDPARLLWLRELAARGRITSAGYDGNGAERFLTTQRNLLAILADRVEAFEGSPHDPTPTVVEPTITTLHAVKGR